MSQGTSPTTDSPPSSQNAQGKRAGSSRLVAVGIAFFLVFLGFVAVAFLLPATYRAGALVVVEASENAKLPKPLEAARRLHDAVLSRELLDRLSAERSDSEDSETRAQTASQIGEALRVSTGDGRSFIVIYTDSDPDRVQRVCNELSQQIARLAPNVLLVVEPEKELPGEREQRQKIQKVAAFLAAHPEVAASGKRSGQGNQDPALRALIAEQQRLYLRLHKLAEERDAGTASDNPYLDPDQWDPPTLKRRLADIEAAISLRKKGTDGASSQSRLSPEVEDEWKGMLKELAQDNAKRAAVPEAREPLLTARVARQAGRPRWPDTPQRPLFLVAGLLMGLAGGTAVWLWGDPTRRRRIRTDLVRPLRPRQVSVAPSGISEAQAPVPQMGFALPRPGSIEPPRLGPAPGHLAPENRAPENRAPENGAAIAAMRSSDQRLGSGGSDSRRSPVRAKTQILGSLPEADKAALRQAAAAAGSRDSPGAGAPALPDPPPSLLPTRSPSGRPFAGTGYSFVSTPPPARLPETVEPEPTSSESLELVRTVAADWQPDPSLNVRARRSLRDQLFPFAIDRCFVLTIVALPDALEEKSRVAVELALALSEPAHQRTLLLEGNFERPAVHRIMRVEVPFGLGFSHQLHGRVQAESQAPLTVCTCGELHVLAEGVMRSPGLTLSRQFEESIERLRRYYDFIVIDGPSSAQQVECRALDAVVDGVVLVCRNRESPAVDRMLSGFSAQHFKTVVATG